ncbi:micronuclear linker histone polyprotein-like isoform X3 [Clytia hemisphaerica]|uniref:RING-type domain-containing protein n=1 Tax=Clytia hemisphaerica TaxID=252671 RepID=A0A7M5WXS6_9CNID
MALSRKAKQKGLELMNRGRTKNNHSSSDANEAPKDCVVCLDKVNVRGVIICAHWFCFVCIHEWSKKTNTCPLCKQRFRCITKVTVGKPYIPTQKVRIKDKNQSNISFAEDDYEVAMGLIAEDSLSEDTDNDPDESFTPSYNIPTVRGRAIRLRSGRTTSTASSLITNYTTRHAQLSSSDQRQQSSRERQTRAARRQQLTEEQETDASEDEFVAPLDNDDVNDDDDAFEEPSAASTTTSVRQDVQDLPINNDNESDSVQNSSNDEAEAVEEDKHSIETVSSQSSSILISSTVIKPPKRRKKRKSIRYCPKVDKRRSSGSTREQWIDMSHKQTTSRTSRTIKPRRPSITTPSTSSNSKKYPSRVGRDQAMEKIRRQNRMVQMSMTTFVSQYSPENEEQNSSSEEDCESSEEEDRTELESKDSHDNQQGSSRRGEELRGRNVASSSSCKIANDMKKRIEVLLSSDEDQHSNNENSDEDLSMIEPVTTRSKRLKRLQLLPDSSFEQEDSPVRKPPPRKCNEKKTILTSDDLASPIPLSTHSSPASNTAITRSSENKRKLCDFEIKFDESSESTVEITHPKISDQHKTTPPRRQYKFRKIKHDDNNEPKMMASGKSGICTTRPSLWSTVNDSKENKLAIESSSCSNIIYSGVNQSKPSSSRDASSLKNKENRVTKLDNRGKSINISIQDDSVQDDCIFASVLHTPSAVNDILNDFNWDSNSLDETVSPCVLSQKSTCTDRVATTPKENPNSSKTGRKSTNCIEGQKNFETSTTCRKTIIEETPLKDMVKKSKADISPISPFGDKKAFNFRKFRRTFRHYSPVSRDSIIICTTP